MSHFEAQLIHHAAPTLRGIKQANLFSLPLEQLPRFREEIARYQKQLAPYGIRLLYLYCCKKRVFLMVYRVSTMERTLRLPMVRAYLVSLGYPDLSKDGVSLIQILMHLRQRMTAYHEFPHEIGFFLGYPISDVFAFIREKGQNCKLVGYWKVYGDESAALHIFQSYEECRKEMMKQVAAGKSIPSLLETA